MCIDEYGLVFHSDKTNPRVKDLCNKDLALNRGLVCQALNAFASLNSKTLTCLDGNSSCGLMGMLWKKYIGGNVKVEINGLFQHSFTVISANLLRNQLEAEVVRDDPCIVLRKKAYDFIFLNCKTTASHYFDSLFSKVHDGAVIAITTSEDPSLYWQAPTVALRNYGGVVAKTSYYRELGVRLVTAEMARAAARYSKGISVLCSTVFKAQQSFTIIVKVAKGQEAAANSLKNIKKLYHCSVCEDRAFAPNSEFALDSPASLLSCECSKNSSAKVVHELGPAWAGAIFSTEFVELMLARSKGFPWEPKVKLLLVQILEEAMCNSASGKGKEPFPKKPRLQEEVTTSDAAAPTQKAQPSFYYNTHRHHPPNHQLLKVTSIVQLLRNGGYRASRTHFDPESVRTNAPLRDYIRILERS